MTRSQDPLHHASRRSGRVVARAVTLAGIVALAGCAGASTTRSTAPVATMNQAWLKEPLTVPEKSAFEGTSRYEDVMAFVNAVVPRSRFMHLDTMGMTFEKRALPLVIVGRLKDFSPEGVRKSGKTVVYVQGNIHAGEVEGKESAQILLRELAAGKHVEWLDSLVLLIAPIYNADGNERFSLTNRPMQWGPINGMGQRPNAQGFDLNRDHIKLESPEANALVGVFKEYDPHVGMDLHTTNGSVHGYYLTYSAPMHPNTDSTIVRIQRTQWFPALTQAVKQKHDWDFYWYGDFGRGPGGAGDTIWSTFEHLPRYNNNYIGLRNRFALLSEAYSYASFEDRIKATNYFLEETIDWAYRHATQIRRATAAADRDNIIGRRMALRAEQERSPEMEQLLVGGSTLQKNPQSGANMRVRTDVRRPKMMYDYGTFKPTETEIVPSSYLIPNTPELADAIAKLRAHGVVVAPASGTHTVEKFVIDSTRAATRDFQGHKERTVFGKWSVGGSVNTSGMLSVSMAQPLARLGFILLEPRSDDGLVDWNFMDRAIEGGKPYPIWRVLR
ncbi:MAG: M14 family metallopeptidase [Longimicrobiales bacterium]